jgi:hypothetical protein
MKIFTQKCSATVYIMAGSIFGLWLLHLQSRYAVHLDPLSLSDTDQWLRAAGLFFPHGIGD